MTHCMFITWAHDSVHVYHVGAGGHWALCGKHYFNHRGARLSAVDYHPATCMLVAGFTNGIFDLYEVGANHPVTCMLVCMDYVHAFVCACVC